MGVHDTVHLDRPRACPSCGRPIELVQLSEEGVMDHFEVGDCISHAEDLAVMREQLYCYACNEHGAYVYPAVFRGILVAIADSLPEAQQMLDSMNVEKIALWYHDVYRRYRVERRDKSELAGFLSDLVQWYTEPDKRQSLYFVVHDTYFRGATDPVDAVRRFLTERDAPEQDDPGGPPF